MERKRSYKYCVVPKCSNTTFRTPNKIFFAVPKDTIIRNKWWRLMKRAVPLSNSSSAYCCEDHFNVEEDMENYTKHRLVGGIVRLKKCAVPHKFECQKASAKPAFAKRRLTEDSVKAKPKPGQSQSTTDEADSSASSGESPDCGGEGRSGRGGEGACAACGGDVGKRGHRVLGSPVEHFIEAAIFPRELNEKTLLCNVCYLTYYDEKKQKDPSNSRKSSQSKVAQKVVEESANVNLATPPTSDASKEPQQKITLPNYKIASCRTENCVFLNCQSKSLRIIPKYEKQRLLRDYKLYTPEHSRICNQHLFSKKWEPVLNISKSDFTAKQIEDVISTLSTNVTAFHADSIEDIPPNLLFYFAGIDQRQLQNMLVRLSILSRKTETPLLALVAYLTKLRMNDSVDRLSALFQIKKTRFEKLTSIAKDCMLNEFVPVNSKAPSSLDKTKKTSGVRADDLILGYLQEYYYKDDGTIIKERKAIHQGCESMPSTKAHQCQKRNKSSGSDDSSLALKVRAKKRLMKEILETNEAKKEQYGQYKISEVGVNPEIAESGIVAQSSEDKQESMQPLVKEEPDDEGEAVDEGETRNSEDHHFGYAPKPTRTLQTDPLQIVPAPLLVHVKSEEDLVTVKEEPEEGDSQAQPTAGTSRPTGDISSSFTVYYTKVAGNFVRDPGPKH